MGRLGQVGHKGGGGHKLFFLGIRTWGTHEIQGQREELLAIFHKTYAMATRSPQERLLRRVWERQGPENEQLALQEQEVLGDRRVADPRSGGRAGSPCALQAEAKPDSRGRGAGGEVRCYGDMRARSGDCRACVEGRLMAGGGGYCETHMIHTFEAWECSSIE